MVTISIIIPVYNVGLYIQECLESIINQTVTDGLECILVDDCGTDNSIKLARQFIEHYDGPIKFKIIRTEKNSGPGARNIGLKKASGDYVFFLDSDDKLAENCIESLAKPIEKRHYDMVMGDYDVEGGEDRFIHLGMKEGECIGREKIAFAKRKHQWSPMVWGKLYRRSFLQDNNILFCEGIIHEDELFFAEIACVAEAVYCLPDLKCYHYRVRGNSIMTSSPYSRKMQSCKILLGHMYDFLSNHSLQRDSIGNDMLYVLFSFANEVSWRESRREYLSKYSEYRSIVSRKYGERLCADRRIKAIVRDIHLLIPSFIGRYVFELMVFKGKCK